MFVRSTFALVLAAALAAFAFPEPSLRSGGPGTSELRASELSRPTFDHANHADVRVASALVAKRTRTRDGASLVALVPSFAVTVPRALVSRAARVSDASDPFVRPSIERARARGPPAALRS
jgi:hypothetical protein